MERITKLQKKIIDAHLESAQRGTWNNEPETKEELINCLKHCESTFEGLHKQIESRYVSITSQLCASPSVFGHITDAYKRDYTKGFKELLNSLNIK